MTPQVIAHDSIPRATSSLDNGLRIGDPQERLLVPWQDVQHCRATRDHVMVADVHEGAWSWWIWQYSWRR